MMPRARSLLVLIAPLALAACLGRAGDGQRAASDPVMNEARKPSNEPMPGSVHPGGYAEAYPARRK